MLQGDKLCLSVLMSGPKIRLISDTLSVCVSVRVSCNAVGFLSVSVSVRINCNAVG